MQRFGIQFSVFSVACEAFSVEGSGVQGSGFEIYKNVGCTVLGRQGLKGFFMYRGRRHSPGPAYDPQTRPRSAGLLQSQEHTYWFF